MLKRWKRLREAMEELHGYRVGYGDIPIGMLLAPSVSYDILVDAIDRQRERFLEHEAALAAEEATGFILTELTNLARAGAIAYREVDGEYVIEVREDLL